MNGDGLTSYPSSYNIAYQLGSSGEGVSSNLRKKQSNKVHLKKKKCPMVNHMWKMLPIDVHYWRLITLRSFPKHRLSSTVKATV